MSRNSVCCAATKLLPPWPHSSAKACMYCTGSIRSLSRNSQHDHLADRLAFVQPVEADVDVGELEVAAHQAIDRQLAAAVKLDVARQIAGRHAGADVASLDRALLGHEVDLRQRERVIGRR